MRLSAIGLLISDNMSCKHIEVYRGFYQYLGSEFDHLVSQYLQACDILASPLLKLLRSVHLV